MKKITSGILGQWAGYFVIAGKAIKNSSRSNTKHNKTWSVLNQRWIEIGAPEYKVGDILFLSAVDPVPPYLVGLPRWMSEYEVWWNGSSAMATVQEAAERNLKTYLSGPYLEHDGQYVDVNSIEIFHLSVVKAVCTS